MEGFLQSQIDFLLFYFGLAYLLVGCICFLMAQIDKKDFFWNLLGVFGLTRGIFQWVYLFKILFGELLWMNHILLFLHVMSFLFLFEFGRRHLEKKDKRFGSWLYIPLFIVLTLSWSFFGQHITSLIIRGLFGVVGGFLAGFVFWQRAKQTNSTKTTLYSSIIFFVFSVCQISFDLREFSQVPNVFLIFIRSIIVTCLMIVFWSEYQNLFIKEIYKTGPKKVVNIKMIRLFVVILFLFSTYLGGYYLINQMGAHAKKTIDHESTAMIEVLTSNLHNIMVLSESISLSLSVIPETKEILSETSGTIAVKKTVLKDSVEVVNHVLDKFVESVGDSVVYIMNKEGTVIASSNRDAKDSFLGKNYSFRPYFIQAMQGKHGSVFAVGITSGLPGYYSSDPIIDENGHILGVAAIKMNLNTFEDILRFQPKAFMISPEQVIFLSSNKNEVDKTLIPISESVKQSVITNKQYGFQIFEPIFSEIPADYSIIKIENKPFVVRVKEVTNDGWKIYLFSKADYVIQYRLFAILSILIFYVFTITFILILQMVKKNVIFSYFASVIYSSQDAIIGKDLSGKILSWNTGAERIYGYKREEIIGKTIHQLLPKDQVEKNDRVITAIHAGTFVDNFEMKHLTKVGGLIDVSVTISPMLGIENEIMGVSMVVRDITRFKNLERVKSEFVSLASHQLRTPLTGIKWFTELLLNSKAGEITKKQKGYLQQISDSNDRMIHLVNDLLEVSHIDDKGNYKIEQEKVNFSNIIQEVVNRQIPSAKQKNVVIHLDESCLKKIVIPIDRVKIEQALQNLISNAIKFSKPKKMIQIGCAKKESDLICWIKDQGLGIPKHQQSRIFEKFFRADNAVEAGQGTGLGLYIAKNIIEAHKGKIWFESEEAKGATFYIALPLK